MLGKRGRIKDTVKKKVNVSHGRCLRFILDILGRDDITNEEVMRTAAMDGLNDTVQYQRRRLGGHIPSLSTDRIAHIAMHCAPEGGSNRGRWPKTWRKNM